MDALQVAGAAAGGPAGGAEPDAPERWLAQERALRCDEGGRLLPAPAGGPVPAAPSADAAWTQELATLRHLIELLWGLTALLPQRDLGAQSADLLTLLVLSQREGELKTARLLARAWYAGEDGGKLEPIARSLEKALAQRLAQAVSRLGGAAGRAPGWSDLAPTLDLALHLLRRRDAVLALDSGLAALDGAARLALVEVVAALAWADGRLAPEERLAFRGTLDRLHLTPAERKIAAASLGERGADLAPALAALRSAGAAHLAFEEAVWASLVDGEQDASEIALLDSLARGLGLDPAHQAALEDAAVAAFQVDHGLLGLHPAGRPSGLLYARVQQRVQDAVRRNLRNLLREIQETGELSRLLLKAGRGEVLSDEERGKVRAQLLDIAKTIPALAVFALPGGGVLLPILIKVLPFNLLPSSFCD